MEVKKSSFILVIGHGPLLEKEDGAAATLRQLGASVRVLDLWQDFSALGRDDEGEARVIVFEAGDRPDLAVTALRAARRESRLAYAPTLLAIPTRQVANVDPGAGFDDFVLVPYVPPELYARIRSLEWKRSEFSNEEMLKVGNIMIDRAAHEVTLDGRRIGLTAKEFALLLFLASQRGRVFSRDVLLARVWGSRYEGGPRTVDIHVRRLRAKLGEALPLDTLRGAGYKLRTPDETSGPGSEDPSRVGLEEA